MLTGSEKAFAAGADIKEMAEKSYVDVLTGDLFGTEIDQISRVQGRVVPEAREQVIASMEMGTLRELLVRDYFSGPEPATAADPGPPTGPLRCPARAISGHGSRCSPHCPSRAVHRESCMKVSQW